MKEDNKQNAGGGKKPSTRRLLLFRVIAILTPVLLLTVVELGLRMVHYGHDLSLFIESRGNPDYVVFNPDASKKYFSNEALATVGYAEPFKKHKDSATRRLFVLGESTTAGYPYFNNGSFHRWLQYRLMLTHPDLKFEIINISLTAVNSFTVWGFAQEVINYQPDGILIYTGHNEYYGCMGVASTDRIAGSSFWVSLVLTLRELRTMQLFTNLYAKITSSDKNVAVETRMKTMAEHSQIPYQSDLYNKGLLQFRDNMDKTLQLFRRHQIPVFISNLVSNESGLRPFISTTPDSAKFPGFGPLFEKGERQFGANQVTGALESLTRAQRIYDRHALCNYYLGAICSASGDLRRARIYFNNAREQDALRFRAPAAINEIIAQLCNRYENAHLVDTKSAYEEYSKGRILGENLILDHVHPNLTGYALMSDVFYRTMVDAAFVRSTADHEMTFSQLRDEMPLTPLDSLVGAYRISFLKENWPFNEAMKHQETNVSTVEEKLAWRVAKNEIPWQNATDSLFGYYMNQSRHQLALKAIEALALAYPRDLSLLEKAAMLCSNFNENRKAVIYFGKAFAISPSFETAKHIFALNLKLDRTTEALPYLDYAIANNTSELNLTPIRAAVLHIDQLKTASANSVSDTAVQQEIAENYLKMGNKDGAMIYIQKSIAHDSKSSWALALLRKIEH